MPDNGRVYLGQGVFYVFVEWMNQAKCANDEQYQAIIKTGVDPLFDKGNSNLKKYCSDCPVIEQCRMAGMSKREPYGLWGGTTPKERAHRLNRLHKDLLKLLPHLPGQLPDASTDPNEQDPPSAG